MMKKNKSVIGIIALCCLLLVCVCALTVAACSKKGDQDVNVNIIGDGDEYEWSYEPAFSDACDADTKIDGILDETRWEGKKWLNHTEKGVQTRYTTSFSEKGLYFAAQAKDQNMQWNSTRAFMKNSSFYIYVISNKATEYHAFDCYGFYIDEKNSRSRQTARWSAKGLRTEDTDGVPILTAELFVTWEALNYTVDETTGMPEQIRCVPQYRYVESVNSADNMFLHPAFAYAVTHYTDSSWAFDKDGYINVDADGAELGDAANGYAKSDGWDLSQVKGDENGENKQVKSIKEYEQAIFFKDIESSRYSYEVKITFNEAIHAGRAYWGVCDMRNTHEFNVLYCNAEEYINTGTCRYFLEDFYNGASARQFGSYSGDKMNECTFRVIKDDTRYYYIMNGKYQNSIELDWLGGKTVPGLYACNINATFSDWEVTDYEGADKDAEFAALCDTYMDMVNVSSSSGGTVTTDTIAMPKASGKEVNITVTPNRGFILTDIKKNGESVFDEVTGKMQNGAFSFELDGSVNIYAEFSELPTDKILRITGRVKRSTGSTVVGLPYSVTCEEKGVYVSGVTSAAGMIDFSVLRKGTYKIGERDITVDGKYTFAFVGEFGKNDNPQFTIDTESDEFKDKSRYDLGDITVNPYKIRSMKLNGEGKIQTTHLTYDADNVSAYYVYPETLSSSDSFEIEVTVDAHNDVWPCYGITLEDENNSSVQFLAAGPTYYRIMSGYESYEQIDKVPTYDKDGKVILRLAYDSVKDIFMFYANDILFDTVQRTKYLSGNSYMYGVCGYMSGADGAVETVTDTNPFATFTVPQVTYEFGIEIPANAELRLADGTLVTNGKVPVCAEVTLTVSVSGESNYQIRVNGSAVDTVVADGKATATFTVTDDNTKAECVPTYTVNGTITNGNENTTFVIVAKENGQVMYSGKGAAFSLELADGVYFVSAEGEKKISKTEFTVDGKSITVTAPLDKEKVEPGTVVAGSGANGASYDATTGMYKFGLGAEWIAYFAEPSVTSSTPFVLTATVNTLTAIDRVAGFAVQTGADKFVRFGLYLYPPQSNPTWWGCYKNMTAGGWQWSSGALTIEENGTIDLTLAYNGGNYYFFVNGELAYTVADYPAPSGKVGLCASHDVTFTDWGYSTDANTLSGLIGATVTADTGITLKVGEKTITDGNVLLGDEVTVSITADPSKEYSIAVDGVAIETVTENGFVTASFDVTDKAHQVTCSLKYAISGTVTGGNDDTDITVLTSGGVQMYTGKGSRFSVALGNGSYVVSVQSADKVGRAVFTVNNEAATVTVELDKEKVAQGTVVGGSGANGAGYDAATGTYKFGSGAEWIAYFATSPVSGNRAFVLTATVQMFTANERAAGFAVQTGEDTFVRFGLRRYEDKYDGISWNSANTATAHDFADGVTLNGDTANLALAYNGGTYYFFINNTLAYTVTGYDAPSSKVGLCASHDVTFTDWGYTTAADTLSGLIGAKVTADSGITLKVGEKTITDGNVLLGDEVTVSVNAASGEKYSIAVDGAVIAVVTAGETAAFDVTAKMHSVTHSRVQSVNGTVTGGDENTDITVLTSGGVSVYTGKGTTFQTELGAGKYYVYAVSADKVGRAEFTVEHSDVSNVTVTLDKEKIAEAVKGDMPTYNAVDGSYSYASGAHGSYFASELTNKEKFVLTATVNKYAEEGKAAGFTVQTGADTYVSFGLEYSAAYWRLNPWQNPGQTWLYENIDGDKINIALVFKNDTYYFFVNNKFANMLKAGTDYPVPSGKVGLYAAHNVTFTDWAIAYNADDYFANLTLNVTGDTPTEIKIWCDFYNDVDVYTGTATTVTLPKGDYMVAASSETKVSKAEAFTIDSAAKEVSLTLDKEKVEQGTVVGGDGANGAGYDAATGTYKFGNGAEWIAYFAEPSVTSSTPFVLTATVHTFNVIEKVAGFAVQTGEDQFVRIGLFLYPPQENPTWWCCSKYMTTGGWQWSSSALTIEEKDTIDLALMYKDNAYHFFINKVLVYTVAVSENYPAPSGKVGLCAAHEITFTDWGYSTDISEYEQSESN